MIDYSILNPIAGGVFVLSMGYMFKQVSHLSKTIEENKEKLNNTNLTYVPKQDCKEDRQAFKASLDKIELNIKEDLAHHGKSVDRIHERIDLVSTAVKKNGNGNGKT